MPVITVYGEQRGSGNDVEHNKGFRITDDGSTVTAEWGPIGNLRSKKILSTSPDTSVRKIAWDKKFKEKFLRKDNPYVIIEKDGVITENRPSSEGRKFGLEVETHSRLSVDEIIEKLRGRGLIVKDTRNRYFQSEGTTWDIKRDGSCGFEFASPKMSSLAGIFDAKLAVEKIREVGGSSAATSKCGVHVTVDISDFTEFSTFKKLVIAYLKSQEHFYNMVDNSRRHNRFCQLHGAGALIRALASTNVRELMLAIDGGNRYYGLNVTNSWINGEFSRVEFRMMEGNVEIRKIGSWIRTCVGFVDGIKAAKITFKSIESIGEETFNAILASTWKV